MSDTKEQKDLDKWALDRIAYLFKPNTELVNCFKYTPEIISIGRHVKPSECLEISRDLTNSIESAKKNELKEKE